MKTGVIYHEFRQMEPTVPTPEPALVLTAAVLKKGRRRLRLWEDISAAINTTCVLLCGACIGVSVLVFTAIML